MTVSECSSFVNQKKTNQQLNTKRNHSACGLPKTRMEKNRKNANILNCSNQLAQIGLLEIST